MRSLEVDSQTTLAHILGELKNTEEDGLELTAVPGEETILANEINRSIIDKVATEYKKEVVFPSSPIENAPEVEDDNLGFVEGEDIFAKAPIDQVPQIMEPVAASVNPVTSQPRFNKNNFLAKLKNKWLLFGVGGLVVIAVLVALLFLLPSATVKLTLAGESKETQVSITADLKVKEASVEDKVVPYTSSQVTKEDSDETSATGKKKVGNPAKGRVTIYNQDTENGKSFLAGTILTTVSATGVTFKTDAAVDLDKAPLGGQTIKDVNVTALQVGPEGNLEANTVFKVGSANATFVFAKNSLAFEGGSVKDAIVVSQDDRDSLKEKIVEKLTKEAEKELAKKVSGTVILEGSLETKIIKETYNPKNVDAEADKLTATIEVQFSAPLIKESDLQKVLLGSLDKSISKDLKIDEDNIKISGQFIEKTSDNKIKLLAKINANLVPEVTAAEIRKQVRGKGVGEAEGYLGSLKGISEYEININPFFMRIFRIMPFMENQINVVISDK